MYEKTINITPATKPSIPSIKLMKLISAVKAITKKINNNEFINPLDKIPEFNFIAELIGDK